MHILVIGGGGREHALVRSMLTDPAVTGMWCAPGNPGIVADIERWVETAPAGEDTSLAGGLAGLNPTDAAAVCALARDIAADLVVIGPEAPLVAGVADAVRADGIACFGPTAAAAQLEGSKAFAKEVMHAAGVPTAQAAVCRSIAELEDAFDTFGAPFVVKADGLAAGKGVVVTNSRTEALEHGVACLGLTVDTDPSQQAAADTRVVIEEFLDGPEVSLFAISDGQRALPLLPAQDFKRVGDDDAGPNTGGMGAYAPLPWADSDLVPEIMREVVEPTLAEMNRRGTPFTGLLYAGLALTSRGMRVVEFNARFGDPETQSVLALLRSPLAQVLHAAATGKLAEVPELEWEPGVAVTVILASQNYPDTPRTDDVITGVGEAGQVPGAAVLHAGTAENEAGELVSAGGRVLATVGAGADIATARAVAYEAMAQISLPGGHFRKDIALRAATPAA